MFSKIDIFLITWTQWVVRQTELYISIERKDFLFFFLKLLKWWTIAWGVTSVLLAFISFPSLISFPLLFIGEMGCSLFMVHYFGYVALSEKTTPKGNLPQEIVSRHRFRHPYFWTVLFSPSFIWILYLMSTSRFADWVIVTIFIFLVFTCVCLTIFLCIEYLLCTTSLPPGKKEKRCIEKEMSKLVPIPIRN